MQNYMEAQNVAAGGGGGMPGLNQAILEINPNHNIVKDLDRMVKADRDSEETKNFAVLMYDIAGMSSGYKVEDIKDFTERVMALMSSKARDDIQDAVVEDEDDIREVEAEIVE